MATPHYQGQQYTQDSHYGNQPVPAPRARKRPPLPRSISSTNIEKTAQCRAIIQQDWVKQAPRGGTNFFATVPAFTLTLPCLDKYPSDFQQVVFNQLIDKATQQSLEGEKCLNWCSSTTRFVPLYTTGDGNCLLHAASLGMWGFHDRDYTLRQAVYTALQNHSTTQLYRRWKYARDLENRHMGIQLEDHQWQAEWLTAVSQASTVLPQGKPLESLDDFHVFVLANVLRRPIVMYAAPKLRSQATGGTLQQINFHGVYLPLLWDPNSCKKDPLPLAYYGGHFVALVAVEYAEQYHRGSFTLPLVDFHGQSLPVRFLLSMEDPTALVMDYLRVVRVSGHNSPYITSNNITCATLSIADRPAYLKPLLSGFLDACNSAHYGNHSRQPLPPAPQTGFDQPPSNPHSNQQLYYGNAPPTRDQSEPVKCINNCGMYGDQSKGGLCSRCHLKHLQTEQEQPRHNYDNQQTQPPPVIIQDSTGFVPRKEPVYEPQKCINHCGGVGDPDKGGLCYRCHQKHVQNEQGMHQPPPHGDQHSQLQRNFPPLSERPSYGNVPPGDQTVQKCINDCGNYADSSGIGLCEKCTEQATQAAAASEGKVPESRRDVQPQPNSSGAQGGSFNSGSIKCPKCPNPGHPGFLGMCERCYHESNFGRQPSPQRGNDHIYETIPGPPEGKPPPPVQDPNVRTQCRTPNCEFFGTAQTANYCSRCFERDMERILREADAPPGGVHQPPNQMGRQQQAPPPQFRPTDQTMQSELPPQQKTGSGEAPKCYKCKEFFANVEYKGLCSGCFMEKTKTETREAPPKQNQPEPFNQAPRYEPCLNRECRNIAEVGGYCNSCLERQEQPRHRLATAPQPYAPHYQKCVNMDCNGPRTQNGFCDNCNMQNGRLYAATHNLGTASSQNPPPGGRPIPKPRQRSNQGPVGNATAPIAQLSSGMDNMALSESGGQCFMCSGSQMGTTNVLCLRHAEMTRRMVPEEMRTTGFDEELVRPKPQGNPPQPYGQPPGRGVHTESHVPQGNPSQPYGQPPGRGAHHVQQSGPPSTQYSTHTQPHPVRRNQGGYSQGLPQGQASHLNTYDQQPQLVARQAPPSQSGFSGANQIDGGQRGMSQSHSRQTPAAQQFGTDLSRDDALGHQAEFEARPPPRQPKPPQGNVSPGRQRSEEVQFGVNMEPPPRQVKGGVAQGATGGGDYQGGEPFLKLLCATAGCSFKGYRELHGYCPDCYEGCYKQMPDLARYPLV